MRPTHLVGHDDVLGTGHLQLAHGIGIRRPADGQQVGTAFFCGEDHVEVLCVVRQRGDECARAIETRIDQIFILRRVTRKHPNPCIAQLLDEFFIGFNDHHLVRVVLQFLNCLFPYTTVAADNNVVVHLIHDPLNSLGPKALPVVSLDEKLGDCRCREGKCANGTDNEDGSE